MALKSQGDLRERTRVLNEVVSIYLHNGRLHRTNAEDFGELSTLFHNPSALVVFPSYEPVEILELAEGGIWFDLEMEKVKDIDKEVRYYAESTFLFDD